MHNAWKWRLTIVLFLATVLTYLDRQTLSLCGSMIRDEFGLSNEQYGQLVGAFRLTYAITHVPAGFIADHMSIRLSYALAAVLWSAAGAFEAFVWGFRPLLMTRSALGIGEGFNWPFSTRIVANMFPPNDRGLAVGIFNSGAAVGSLVAPFIIMPLAIAYGWRTAFFAIGSIGFLWVIVWLAATRPGKPAYAAVDAGRRFSAVQRLVFAGCFVAVGVGVPVLGVQFGSRILSFFSGYATALGESLPLLSAWALRGAWLVLGLVVLLSLLSKGVKSVAFWMLFVVAVTVNPCWYFLNEWIPMYLHDKRGFNYLSAGMFTVPIFLAADAGNIVSGGLIKFLTTRGWPLRKARGTVLALAAGMVLPVTLVPYVENSYTIIALLALGAFGITSILANYTACQGDLSLANAGVIAGILGMSSNVCAALANPRIGAYVDRTGKYDGIFLLVGLVPLLSVVAILVFDTVIHGRKKAAETS